MRTLPVVILLLCACDPPPLDLGRPFAPLAVESSSLPAAPAQAAFALAIAQLGGRIEPGAAQQIHLVLDPDCGCPDCVPVTASYPRLPNTIKVCPAYKQGPKDELAHLVMHEFGHLCWADHLPCESGAVMAPSYGCAKDPLRYQGLDLTAICAAGGVTGGVCG